MERDWENISKLFPGHKSTDCRKQYEFHLKYSKQPLKTNIEVKSSFATSQEIPNELTISDNDLLDIEEVPNEMEETVPMKYTILNHPIGSIFGAPRKVSLCDITRLSNRMSLMNIRLSSFLKNKSTSHQ